MAYSKLIDKSIVSGRDLPESSFKCGHRVLSTHCKYLQDVNNHYSERKAGKARPVSREVNESGQETTGIDRSKWVRLKV